MNFDRTSLTKMGNYIANQRKNKGYTQKKLAEFLDVSDKTVSKWEQGFLAPDVTILKPLAQALDTNIDSLVNGENCKNFFKYNNEAKKHKLIIIFFIFTIAVALFSFYMGGRGKYNSYKLKSSGIFNVNGYLISSDDESIIMIEDIRLINTKNKINDDLFKSASIEIYSGKTLFYTNEYNIGKPFTLQKFLNESSIMFEYKIKIKKSKLKIRIIFHNMDDVKYSYDIDFT